MTDDDIRQALDPLTWHRAGDNRESPIYGPRVDEVVPVVRRLIEQGQRAFVERVNELINDERANGREIGSAYRHAFSAAARARWGQRDVRQSWLPRAGMCFTYRFTIEGVEHRWLHCVVVHVTPKRVWFRYPTYDGHTGRRRMTLTEWTTNVKALRIIVET